ncbi:hypothetical protein HQ590_11235, partial [bacterium]|nr:hypothetical protein [bacterium]
LYRWYPRPARLTGDGRAIALRPFEVVLLEVVPAGQAPTLDRPFPGRPMPRSFAEPTVGLELAVSTRQPASTAPDHSGSAAAVPLQSPTPLTVAGTKRGWAIAGQTPVSRQGGTLVITATRSKGGLAFQGNYPDREWRLAGRIGGQQARPVPALHGQIYPTAWQTWRMPVCSSVHPQRFTFTLTALVPDAVVIRCRGYFIPRTSTARPDAKRDNHDNERLASGNP